MAKHHSAARSGQEHPRARYTDHEIDLALELLDTGTSQRKVAKKMDIPRRTLRDWSAGTTRAQRIPGEKGK